MRKQIAAANWKMNLGVQQAHELMDQLLQQPISLSAHQQVLVATPFPYLIPIQQKINHEQIHCCAQNIASTKNGAFTGETSAEILSSISINFAIIGHSERREMFHEDHAVLALKVNQALSCNIQPVFCCGEPLAIREAETQNRYVETQLKESLFHLDANEIKKCIIAYEPIWAIGTGKTASSDQAQEMHAHIRSVLAAQYGHEVADAISILYGGSVKASNAAELFAKPDVDGGLVGGASLIATEFAGIINALK